MQVIIISSAGDASTDIVCAWLHSYGIDPIVLQTEYFDFPEPEKISRVLKVLEEKVDLRIWYRTNYFQKIASLVPAEIRSHLRAEFLSSVPFLLDVKADKILGSCKLYSGLSKIEVLGIAGLCGLKTPEYIVTNSKNDLRKFQERHNGIIVKPLSEIFVIDKNSDKFKTLTYSPSPTDINALPDYFGITWAQERVPNAFDLRICYLDGKIYPALIVKHKSGALDVIDYRDYASSNAHMSKIELSEDINLKIRKLMNKLEYNFGVLDFIITPGNECIFLEVNEYGVFNDISLLYGFGIEYEIAQWLIN